jgi:hypothetical protein
MNYWLRAIALLFCFFTSIHAQQRPNILFAIADDWGYGHASAYGCKWVKTPAFDRVAQAGLLFTRAYTPNAKCAPSRAILLTGRNSWQLEEAANHIPFFPAKFKTWAEALSEKGYFAGVTTKGWGPGEAKDANGKPREMAGKPFNARKLKPAASGIGNADYAGTPHQKINPGAFGTAQLSRIGNTNTALARQKAARNSATLTACRSSGRIMKPCVTTCWITRLRSNILIGT